MNRKYKLILDTFGEFIEVAQNRNKAIYKSFKKYKNAGYKTNYIEFKKMIKSCKGIK